MTRIISYNGSTDSTLDTVGTEDHICFVGGPILEVESWRTRTSTFSMSDPDTSFVVVGIFCVKRFDQSVQERGPENRGELAECEYRTFRRIPMNSDTHVFWFHGILEGFVSRKSAIDETPFTHLIDIGAASRTVVKHEG